MSFSFRLITEINKTDTADMRDYILLNWPTFMVKERKEKSIKEITRISYAYQASNRRPEMKRTKWSLAQNKR